MVNGGRPNWALGMFLTYLHHEKGKIPKLVLLDMQCTMVTLTIGEKKIGITDLWQVF